MAETESPADVTALVVQLLGSYLSNNSVPAENLPGLIRETKAALMQDGAEAPAASSTSGFAPAVSVRKSLSSQDHILSLIDGKPYKTLKRHLTSNGLTPEQYRERYGLPANYPLVAPNFAEQRRAIAARIGLGSNTSTRKAKAEPAVAAEQAAEAQPAPVKAQPAPKKTAAPVKAAKKAAPAEAPKPRRTLKLFSAAPAPEASETAPAPAKEPKSSAAKAPTRKPRASTAVVADNQPEGSATKSRRPRSAAPKSAKSAPKAEAANTPAPDTTSGS